MVDIFFYFIFCSRYFFSGAFLVLQKNFFDLLAALTILEKIGCKLLRTLRDSGKSGTQGRGSREFLVLSITRTYARYICYLPVNSTSDRLRPDLAAMRERHDETDRQILQLIADTAELDARVSAMLAEDRPQ